jgi:glycine dehydrogenase subunit 1
VTYLFDTPEQRQKMLQAIGVNSVDELFEQIPAALQLDRELRLPPALSELELQHEMEIALGAAGSSPLCFMGGGAYDHFIPAVVDEITSRGEFYTAYTPYGGKSGNTAGFF